MHVSWWDITSYIEPAAKGPKYMAPWPLFMSSEDTQRCLQNWTPNIFALNVDVGGLGGGQVLAQEPH